MAGVFSGIKVLDLSRVIAGPLCTQMLSDAGATVYKIERPGQGDDTRAMGPFLEGRHGDKNASTVFLSYNRGKKSLTIDISTPDGAALVKQLATTCDVVVENFKAGNLAKYGLDYQSIKAVNPEVVYCSISGFGQDGPYASYVAYDFILQGLAGVMSSCGHADGEAGGGPMRTAIPITDVVAGLTAHIAIIGALFHRFRTGKGQYIDASLLDASVALNGHLAVSYLATGQEHQRVGNRNPIAAPSEVFQCADGYLIIAAGNDRQFAALCKVLGLEALAVDERFKTNALRVQNREVLNECLRDKIRTYDRQDLLEALRQVGAPSGPINTMAEVFADPQVQQRELTVEVDYEGEKSLTLLRSPLRFSLTPTSHTAPPLLGEHTEEVLANELDLTVSELELLKQRGVI